jgi:hypothetical protein
VNNDDLEKALRDINMSREEYEAIKRKMIRRSVSEYTREIDPSEYDEPEQKSDYDEHNTMNKNQTGVT